MTWQCDKLSKDHGIEFDPSYRRYLEAVLQGGINGWAGSADGEPESPPMIEDVPGIFGISDMFAYYAAPPTELHFWDRKLLKHAYCPGSVIS